jgi:UBX domain-containing protein 1
VATQGPDPNGLDDIVKKAKDNGKKEKSGENEESKSDVKITLWQNGFQVDEGPLRDYNAPENKEFMKEITAGYVPKELV